MKRAPMYLHLFHGRDTVNESMDGAWGYEGPVLRIEGFHVTYLSTFRIGLPASVDPNKDWVDLSFVDGLLYYDGKYYGDWSVFAEGTDPPLIARAEDVVLAKLEAPVPPEQKG